MRVIVKNLEKKIKEGTISKLPAPPSIPERPERPVEDKDKDKDKDKDSSSMASNKAKLAGLFKPPPGMGKPPSPPPSSNSEMSDDGLPGLNPKIKMLEKIGVPCGKLVEEIRNSELPDWDADKMDTYFNKCCVKKKKTRGEVEGAQETDMSCLDNKIAEGKYKLPLFEEQKLKITKSDKPSNKNQEHKLLLSQKVKERSSKKGIDIDADRKKQKEEKERLENERLEKQEQERIRKSEERAKKVKELDQQRQEKKDLYDKEAKKKGEA